MENNDQNEEIENNNDLLFLRDEIEKKNSQIKNLQNKLDSQDIIINDYYKIKNISSESKIELLNLEKNKNFNFRKQYLKAKIKAM